MFEHGSVPLYFLLESIFSEPRVYTHFYGAFLWFSKSMRNVQFIEELGYVFANYHCVGKIQPEFTWKSLPSQGENVERISSLN